MSVTNLCPCGSEKDLKICCLPLIQGQCLPETAEDLLRARYTAFTQAEVAFILKTHHSRTRGEMKEEEIEDWAKNSEWLGLQIVEKAQGQKSDEKGVILFGAPYRDRKTGKTHEHWEKSFFEKEKGEWRFLDAQGVQMGPIKRTEPKIGRNDPCKCGSGKKSKKCCGTSAQASN